MISSGDLYDWSEELEKADKQRLRAMCRELIDNTHRIRHLLEDMADFRNTLEHERQMKMLDDITKTLEKLPEVPS